MTDNKSQLMPTAPPPSPMPVDREVWATQLNLSNFVNTYYQYRDLQSLPSCRRVLIIGPGQGLDTNVLKWRGYEVVTFDIDQTFSPDYLGSVHDLSMFGTGEFDAVIASHVLEHLAAPYLQSSLQELSRVARYALIYLPVHGRHLHFRFVPGITNLDWSFILDLANPFAKTDGLTPRYMAKQHFWEVGIRGYRISDLKKRMAEFFDVISTYRNRDWIPSQNFVLKSKTCGL
jgi:predicted SAM-dependent methyltransferase